MSVYGGERRLYVDQFPDKSVEAADADQIASVDSVPNLTATDRKWMTSGTAQALLGQVASAR